MTASTFPYLTPQILEADGAMLLAKAQEFFPQIGPYLRLAELVVPLTPTIVSTRVTAILLEICSHINAITRRTPPAVTA